jgi:4-amino-4-deoxy-L-arabinose transferase-like glycosyltransferase
MKLTFLTKIKTVSPFLLFFPFFLLYVVIILVFHNRIELADDEARYLGYAKNLTHGYYAAPPPNDAIINGPGYPIVLMPFAALNTPVLLAVLANALFYYLSVVFLYKTLLRISSFKIALFISLFWACYYNSYQDMLFAFTEPLTCLIVSLLLYFLTRAFENSDNRRRYMILAGIAMGYLALTKIVFCYVVLFIFFGNCLVWLLNRRSLNHKRNLVILLIAFATMLPYLIYTYTLTGRVFYVGNPGADALYWMSNPNRREYGDWLSYPRIPGPDTYRVHFSEDSLAAHHKRDFDSIYQFEGAKRDDAFKSIAIRNIKTHPVKFIENCVSNMGRMLFSFPNSYTLQNNKTLLRLPLTGLILLFSVFSFFPTILNWRKISYPIRFLLFFVLIYLGLSTLVSGLTRMFTVVAPVFLVWIAFIVQRTLTVRLKFQDV